RRSVPSSAPTSTATSPSFRTLGTGPAAAHPVGYVSLAAKVRISHARGSPYWRTSCAVLVRGGAPPPPARTAVPARLVTRQSGAGRVGQRACQVHQGARRAERARRAGAGRS